MVEERRVNGVAVIVDTDQDERFWQGLSAYAEDNKAELFASGRRNDDMVNVLVFLCGCNPKEYLKTENARCVVRDLSGPEWEFSKEHFYRILPYVEGWLRVCNGIADFDWANYYTL